MKVKEESIKAGLHLYMKKTKIMTAEQSNNFNVNDEDIEIVKDFVYLDSVINLNRDFSQESKRRLGLGRAAVKGLGKVTK